MITVIIKGFGLITQTLFQYSILIIDDCFFARLNAAIREFLTFFKLQPIYIITFLCSCILYLINGNTFSPFSYFTANILKEL